ncbi:spore-associated protein A [Nocardiopsis sp. EMB25]|uniref:spore-associated protein A n=1 Tax=Nocardiopsis sp. EMB25 TaxID=2835867 RepID=UPI002283C39F|nr:spore-associated protein A [Nocardiopsis sp. EMB25]MCY9786239.1 spore-associated protein A [Nocardiopsis sp. EMB25]
MHRTLVRGAAVALALAATVALAAPAPATAASYGGQCGDGYGVLGSADVSGGTVFVTYNSSEGKNCVVTVRNSTGSAISMDAALKLSSGTSWQTDPGQWQTYAGPVYLSAAGQCVDWGGSIQDNWVVRNGTFCS